jgi:hypothetical protein
MKHSLTYKGKQTKHFKKYVNELIMRVESHNWICQIPDSLQLAYNHINTLNFGQAHCPAQKYPECYCWYNCCACPQLPVCWMPQPYCSTQSPVRKNSVLVTTWRDLLLTSTAKIESLIQERVILQEPSHTFQWKKTPFRNRLLGYIWC